MTDELDKAIDEVCNRFEAAWDAFLAGEGKRPVLEEHLQQVAAGKEKSFAQSLIDSYKKLNKPEEAAKWQAELIKLRTELGSQSPQPKSNSATAPEKQPST